jgi:outer membrane biosynthesis protein TonB
MRPACWPLPQSTKLKMIARSLVPFDARPPVTVDAATDRRRPTTMDERTLVPAMLPVVPLNGHTTIPANLPLDAIAARVVVPRDVYPEAYGVHEDFSKPLQPTDLDERITVPQGAAAPKSLSRPLYVSTDLVDPDVFLTGEVHLGVSEQTNEKVRWQYVTNISSGVLHFLFIVALLVQPKLFPPHQPTAEEYELARKQMTVLLPPGALDAPKKETNPKDMKSETIRVDPRVIRKIAPQVEPQPSPGAREPERVVKNLPDAPLPQPNLEQTPTQQNTPLEKSDAAKTPTQLETPDQQPTPHGILLPKVSPGRAIQDSVREAAKMSAPTAIGGGGQLPSSGIPGGGGQGAAYGTMEMLTPTEGVDFNNYLARVYASVKQNWFAVMPESVRLGDRGIVVLHFKIMRNGNVPAGEPVLERGSGKEPLDRAAHSSIRASNPFEPLPSAFSGDYIELRFAYYYNIMIPDYTQ